MAKQATAQTSVTPLEVTLLCETLARRHRHERDPAKKARLARLWARFAHLRFVRVH